VDLARGRERERAGGGDRQAAEPGVRGADRDLKAAGQGQVVAEGSGCCQQGEGAGVVQVGDQGQAEVEQRSDLLADNLIAWLILGLNTELSRPNSSEALPASLAGAMNRTRAPSSLRVQPFISMGRSHAGRWIVMSTAASELVAR
jgi:hypothetical protein